MVLAAEAEGVAVVQFVGRVQAAVGGREAVGAVCVPVKDRALGVGELPDGAQTVVDVDRCLAVRPDTGQALQAIDKGVSRLALPVVGGQDLGQRGQDAIDVAEFKVVDLVLVALVATLGLALAVGLTRATTAFGLAALALPLSVALRAIEGIFLFLAGREVAVADAAVGIAVSAGVAVPATVAIAPALAGRFRVLDHVGLVPAEVLAVVAGLLDVGDKPDAVAVAVVGVVDALLAVGTTMLIDFDQPPGCGVFVHCRTDWL
ncbi:MAG: hypothetical protein ACYC9Q_14755 [Bacillota bacterium]